MLNHLRWRIVGSCALASAVALGLFAAMLYQTGRLQLTTPEAHAMLALFYLLALSVALAISLSSSRLLLGPTFAAIHTVARWARTVAGETQAASEGPIVDGDLTDLANSVRELGRVLQAEITALQAERSRLALALDHMENGVVVIDGYHRIVLINPAAARLLRTTPLASEGRSLVEIARDHELVAVADACLKLGAKPPGPGAKTVPEAGVSPTLIELGEPARSVQVVATPVPGSRDRPGVLLLLQDVTQLRQADVIRREFVANVSHELRTPLAGLKALAETLDAGALDDPPAARGFLGHMLIEVDRLTGLVQELLELAGLESGAPALSRESVDLHDAAKRAQQRIASQADQAGVAVRVDAPEEPALVTGDPLRLERVFVNLMENALKYTEQGGAVTVRFRRDAQEIVATVSDTGQGISAEDLPRIFERFFKGDKARSSPGTGLGLAIVKHTVQAHGGAVWVESVEGRGSTFFVSLPTKA